MATTTAPRPKAKAKLHATKRNRYKCPTCAAKPNEPCMTRAGKVVSEMHTARAAKATAAR